MFTSLPRFKHICAHPSETETRKYRFYGRVAISIWKKKIKLKNFE